MEASVRYIRLGAEGQEYALKPALCFRGSTVAYAVLNDDLAVEAYVIKIQAYDRAALVLFAGDPYPVDRYLRHMAEIGRRKPITERARSLLEGGLTLEGDMPEPVAVEPPSAPTERKKAPTEAPKASAVPSPETKVRRSPKPATEGAGRAPKAPKDAKKPAKVKLNTVAELALELKMTPVALRVKLRQAGMHAPYTDIKAMKKALK